MPPKLSRPGPGSSRVGFTIVELMVACVIVATALLGIYGLFRQAVDVIGNSSISWANRGAARATLDHLCEAVEQTVNIEGFPTLIGRRTKDGRNVLVCLVAAWGGEPASGGHGGMEWRRYSWLEPAGPSQPARLELQTVPVAGSQPILDVRDLQELPEENAWIRIEPTIVGSGISHLRLRYRALKGTGSDWQSRWEGPVGNVAVRIAVKCGHEHVECVAIPRAAGSLVSARGDQ